MSTRRIPTVLLLILAGMLLTLPQHPQDQDSKPQMVFIKVQPAQGETTGTKSFVIFVSHKGFNGTHSSNLVITVNEGDMVHITFIMDEEDRKNNEPNNRHILEIPEYGLQTEEISPSHPEATIVFLADVAGTFTIRCSPEAWDCPGHDLLQDGKLVVKAKEAPPKDGKSQVEEKSTTQPEEEKPAEKPPTAMPEEEKPAEKPPTAIKTELKLDVVTTGFPLHPILLTATLTDSEGKPVAGMPITFTFNTTFGPLKIRSRTDSKGVASVNYSRAIGGNLEVTALFSGGGGYEATTSKVVKILPVVAAEPAAPLLTARNTALIIVVTVVLSVWATYFLVLLQIIGLEKGNYRKE